MSEKDIRAKFKAKGLKICRISGRNVFRVYSMQEKNFIGSYNTYYTMQELQEIAASGNFLQFFLMI